MGPKDPPAPPPPPRLFLDQTEAESMDPPLWSKPRYIATFFLKPGKRHARAVQLSYKVSAHEIFREFIKRDIFSFFTKFGQ